MTRRRAWHQDEQFWKTFQSFIFPPEKVEEAQEQIEQLLSLLDLDPDSRVLDIACGVGRHAIELSKRGFTVTGVDATRPYLETAEERARKEDTEVEFVCEDMRKFKQTKSFDAIVNLYTSFGYFEKKEDDEIVAGHFYDSLKPGGTLVMSLAGKEELARDFQKRTWVEKDGTYFLEEHSIMDDWSRMENRWILIEDGKLEEFEVSLRVYSAVELSNLLYRAGFKGVEVYGDFEGGDYDENAEKLVVVARK